MSAGTGVLRLELSLRPIAGFKGETSEDGGVLFIQVPPGEYLLTAHKRGACVVAVFTRDVAETKATRATEAGRRKGYPLLFTTEPEE